MTEIKQFHRMWACNCIPETGARVHDHTIAACPDCGRLQPPHDVKEMLPIGPAPLIEGEGSHPGNQCLPNPEDQKLMRE